MHRETHMHEITDFKTVQQNPEMSQKGVTTLAKTGKSAKTARHPHSHLP